MQAYHITFGTYGTRLHGDDRGTVDRQHNHFLQPFLEPDVERETANRSILRFPPVYLALPQRVFVEEHLPAICNHGQWRLHAVAAAIDHVHVCLSGAAEGKKIRKWLKRWLGESLNAIWPLAPGQPWWAEDGSVKWIFDDQYLANVVKYINEQRTTVSS